MATNSFLKVTTVTSATLALLASTATAAYAEETVTPAPAETTAATSTDATVAPEVTAEATPAESTEAPAETAEAPATETPVAPAAETTPVTAPASTDEGKLNAWFQPGDFVRTSDGLFVMTSMGIVGGPDGGIGGAGGFQNYNLEKLFLEFEKTDDAYSVRANVYDALDIPRNLDTQHFRGLGAWGTSNPDVLLVDEIGRLIPLADGDVTIGFKPAFIENNTVVYRDLSYTINLTVKDGVLSVAEEAPKDDSVIDVPIKLGDGVLFSTADEYHVDADGNAIGFTSIPAYSLAGTRVVVGNADSLTVGSTLDLSFDYTKAVGRESIDLVVKDNPKAKILGGWSSSDSSVVEVREDDGVSSLVAVGAGTVTLTFTPDYIEAGKLATSPLTYTIQVTVAPEVAPVEPAPPVEPEPAPLDPAPVDPTPAPDPAPVDPAPAPEQPAPPVADPTDPAAPFVYENCAAVYEAGAAPIREGDHGWHKSLDTDGDGVGCEVKPDYTNEKDAGKKEAAQKQKSDAASKTGNQQLAKTGADGVAPLMGGLALVAAGASAVAVSRRRTK